jgi:hypothetical protein
MTKLSADDPHDPHDPHDRPDRRRALEPAGRRARAAPIRAKAKTAQTEPPAEVAPSSPAFERGARVRVMSGPFAGKSGVVQELVGRKSARVLLGLLPVQIDLDDLAPAAPGGGGRGRPRLASSHRKPVPARS